MTAKRELIAVVDDDEAARDALGFLLEALDRAAEVFPSARDFLQAGPQNFARLILDQHMEGMTGLQLVTALRSARVDIPVMLVSGDLTAEIASEAASLGIEKVTEKPPSLEDLAAFLG